MYLNSFAKEKIYVSYIFLVWMEALVHKNGKAKFAFIWDFVKFSEAKQIFL